MPYSRTDEDFVDIIYERLKREGVPVWLDRHDVLAGDLQKQISKAIRINDVVLLVLSGTAIKSDWVESELDMAAENRDVLCPISIDDAWKTKLENDGAVRKPWRELTDKRTEIQIESEKASGGWDAINLATGKKILIKSAQRLLGTVGARKGRTKATEATVAEIEPVTVEATSAEVAVPKKVRRAKATESVAVEKKLSAIEAALKVLSETPEPMNTKQLIDSMASKGLWTSPGGKTPHATLYSAILREIVTKGDESRFVKAERGRFTTNA